MTFGCRGRKARAAIWLCLLSGVPLACGGKGQGNDASRADTAADVPLDGTPPTEDGPDARADAPTDAPADAAMDAPAPDAVDAAPDVMDAAPETATPSDAADVSRADGGLDSPLDAPRDTSNADTSPPSDGGGGDRPDGGRVPTFSGLSLLAGLPGGPGRADGPAANARFNDPNALFADGVGNLFVADSSNYTVRKIVIATGVVSTLAGLPGTPGTTDGVGANARFSYLRGLAGDGAGHLFVVDGSATIRRIDLATAAVTTLAGMSGVNRTTDGTGTGAAFNIPNAIAHDGAGHLLVVEASAIRLIDVATGAVTTLADGTGAAVPFESPAGLACDRAGNLFVTDAGSIVRKLVIATGEVTTLAGAYRQTGKVDATGAAARFLNPYGLSYDAGTLYVADSGNAAIRKIVVATGAVSTIAAVDSNPYAVVGDGAGSLFVASTFDHSIRKLNIATGAATLFAGVLEHRGSTDASGSAARFYEPRGLLDDGAGNLFVADAGNSTMRKIVIASGAVTTIAGSPGMSGAVDATGAAARFNNPIDMVRNGGELFITENSSVIRKLTVATATVTTAAVLTPYNYGLAFDGATTLFASNSIDHTIAKASTTGGSGIVIAGLARSHGYLNSTGASARFDSPAGLAYDGAGNLFVADTNNSVIRKVIVATGVVSTLAGAGGQRASDDGVGPAARFQRPVGLAYDRAGGLFVADTENHTIRYIDIASATVTTVIGDPNRAEVVLGALPAGLTAPRGLTVGAGGALYISDENSVLVAR